jgi:hypothetical protein
MSSNSILNATANIVQEQILPLVPKVWKHQFQFGLQAFTSANSNARTSGLPKGTAENKMSRLLHNKKLPKTLTKMTAELSNLTEASIVNVDHSDFNGLVALVFAAQTKKGRALPIFLQTAYSGKLSTKDDAPKRTQALRLCYESQEEKDKETDRTIATLLEFRSILAFWPKLVFDRGFGSQAIVELLDAKKAIFYIRMKAGRYAEIGGNLVQLKTLAKKDSTVTLYGLQLRVVRSPKNGKNDEPWYILTNDMKRSRTKVVRIYYHRFEIEEIFRDIKSIVGAGKTRLNKPLSLKILLWFILLGVLLLYRGGLEALGSQLWTKLKPRGHKKRISWFRMLFELRQHEINQLAFGSLVSLGWGEKC